jgi:hypothetical protein
MKVQIWAPSLAIRGRVVFQYELDGGSGLEYALPGDSIQYEDRAGSPLFGAPYIIRGQVVRREWDLQANTLKIVVSEKE